MMLNECLGLRKGIFTLTLEAITMGYFQEKTFLMPQISYALFFKSIYSVGAPVISRSESQECPMLVIQKFPYACAYAFSKIIRLISFRTGFVNILGNRLSTSIFMFFPLSNRFTQKLLVFASQLLNFGIRYRSTLGRWARLASVAIKQQLPNPPCLTSVISKLKLTYGFYTIMLAQIPSQKTLYYQLVCWPSIVSSNTFSDVSMGKRSTEVKLSNYLPALITKVYFFFSGAISTFFYTLTALGAGIGYFFMSCTLGLFFDSTLGSDYIGPPCKFSQSIAMSLIPNIASAKPNPLDAGVFLFAGFMNINQSFIMGAEFLFNSAVQVTSHYKITSQSLCQCSFYVSSIASKPIQHCSASILRRSEALNSLIMSLVSWYLRFFMQKPSSCLTISRYF